MANQPQTSDVTYKNSSSVYIANASSPSMVRELCARMLVAKELLRERGTKTRNIHMLRVRWEGEGVCGAQRHARAVEALGAALRAAWTG